MSIPQGLYPTALVLLVLALGASAWSREQRGEKEASKVLKEARQISEERLRVQKTLIEFLERGSTTDETRIRKGAAMQLLGELEADEAVPSLIKHIALSVAETVESERCMSNWYPAVGALSRIGKPATQPLLDAIAGCKDADRRYLYFWALAGIETWPGAIFLLENRLKETKDEQAAASFRAALKIAKKP